MTADYRTADVYQKFYCRILTQFKCENIKLMCSSHSQGTNKKKSTMIQHFTCHCLSAIDIFLKALYLNNMLQIYPDICMLLAVCKRCGCHFEFSANGFEHPGL